MSISWAVCSAPPLSSKSSTAKRARAPSPGDHSRSEVRTNRALARALLREQIRLGALCRTLRKERGLTQERAAEAILVNPKHLSKIERGDVNVTLATLVAIARAYGIDLGTLFAPLPTVERTRVRRRRAK